MTGIEVAKTRIEKEIMENQGHREDNSDLHNYEKGYLKGLRQALKIIEGEALDK